MRALFALFCLCFSVMLASEVRASTASLYGSLGLNTVPSARIDDTGTIRAHIATVDPYIHTSLHMQIASPLTLTLRQSAEVSSLNDAADRLYPGVDFKLRLHEESAYIPEMALGMISAFGHKRMASEYLAFSKRYKDFDFTAGMAWGRLGSAGHVKNPLALFGGHFDKTRALDGEMPHTPHNWFTGSDIGFFGGVAYDAPWIRGLTFKADWGADKYRAERAAFDYHPPAPWAIGFNYTPRDWVSIGGALLGTDKLMGQISFQSPVAGWPGRPENKTKPQLLYPYRSTHSTPRESAIAAAAKNIDLYNVGGNEEQSWALLSARPSMPLPRQIGRTARHMSNHAMKSAETLIITPTIYGLKGHTLHLNRRDIENALGTSLRGSPQEIWYNAAFKDTPPPESAGKIFPFTPPSRTNFGNVRFFLDNTLSLSEEDSGILYRTSLVMEERKMLTPHLLMGGDLRLNIKDNLGRLSRIRPAAALPVRSDIDHFTQKRIEVDRLFAGWLKTVKTDMHLALSFGHLEEMYAGTGGEFLWRPFGKTFALGAEGWLAFKRDPATAMHLALNGDHLLSGHVQGWYEIPQTPLTVQARIGRYLAEDVGGTLALSRDFENGATVEAFVTATDNADYDLFGGTTHVYSGLKFSMPLGNSKYLTEGSAIRLTAAPQGRDSGQALDSPLPLYELTQPLSYRSITQNWRKIGD